MGKPVQGGASKMKKAASDCRLLDSCALVCGPPSLYGLPGRDGPDLEVLDIDLVMAQDCGLKGV